MQVQYNAYTAEFLFLFEIIRFAFNARRQGLSQSGLEVEAPCDVKKLRREMQVKLSVNLISQESGAERIVENDIIGRDVGPGLLPDLTNFEGESPANCVDLAVMRPAQAPSPEPGVNTRTWVVTPVRDQPSLRQGEIFSNSQ